MTPNLDAESQYVPLPIAPPLKDIASAHPEVIEELKRFEPIATAAAFGSLLTIPQLQSNCFRIEVLVHLAIAYCQGTSAPTQEVILRAFEQLGRGICGRMDKATLNWDGSVPLAANAGSCVYWLSGRV